MLRFDLVKTEMKRFDSLKTINFPPVPTTTNAYTQNTATVRHKDTSKKAYIHIHTPTNLHRYIKTSQTFKLACVYFYTYLFGSVIKYACV